MAESLQLEITEIAPPEWELSAVAHELRRLVVGLRISEQDTWERVQAATSKIATKVEAARVRLQSTQPRDAAVAVEASNSIGHSINLLSTHMTQYMEQQPNRRNKLTGNPHETLIRSHKLLNLSVFRFQRGAMSHSFLFAPSYEQEEALQSLNKLRAQLRPHIRARKRYIASASTWSARLNRLFGHTPQPLIDHQSLDPVMCDIEREVNQIMNSGQTSLMLVLERLDAMRQTLNELGDNTEKVWRLQGGDSNRSPAKRIRHVEQKLAGYLSDCGFNTRRG